MSKSSNALIALAAGAAIGVAAGMLYAPDSGEITRKKLKKQAKKAQKDIDKKARETYAQVSTKANELTSNLSSRATELRGTVGDRIETALSSASYKADDAIVALENKLEQLRTQNAKLQKPQTVNGAVKKAAAKTTVKA
ncbi:YtxH domain-containing protein [Nonlabens xiamenensis]|uniref:YtxH domain-containing protein n=1 Tax=Nonlabens xiamenensis TaxID=2341043 RepID=UPI000F60A72E|nr:YtxH domain-containing protein [Nonlabens xiamenensis]